ncbi:ABC transporter substrate-binding protein [Pseudooceanicola sp. MF1-13]|uniref:ABC transporter substrate-binding protein n=1 Tax=Pseudooceanicola sp. MF1-13 TaxID=3379095 RepID=UPI003891B1B7
MTKTLKFAAAAAFAGVAFAGPAMAQECGANTGEAATGEPIIVGGIHGNAAPGDFSAATDSAAAYFACVNANGGIHGRPIDYRVENDQWNPELAAQAAAKLVNDTPTVALVGNGSFIEMGVNAKTYEDADIMVMASACAISECFETPNIVSTNQGPLPSNLGAVIYAYEELDAQNVSCIGLNIPNNGIWSCQASIDYMKSKGGDGSMALLNPAAPDVNSVLLEAISSGADTILINQPAGLALAILKAAEEQDLRDDFNWIAPTPLYDLSIPDQLSDYWDGHVYVSAELAPLQVNGPDAQNWLKVMDAYARDEDPRDTFSQSGYLSAKFFTETLLEMDPADVGDRAKVADAIRGISGKTSDLMCGPYYVGDADFHMPNHAGYIVKIVADGYEIVRDCFEYDAPYFEKHKALEAELGLR